MMFQDMGKNAGFKVGSVMIMLTIEFVNVIFAVSLAKNTITLDGVLFFWIPFIVSNVFGLTMLALSKVGVSDFVKITKAFSSFIKVAEK